MKRNACIAVILIVGCWTPVSAAEPAEEVVAQYPAFFEHLFTTISMTSGVHRNTYLTQVGLTEQEGHSVVAVVTDFKRQEDALRAQAEGLLRVGSAASEDALEPLRAARHALMKDSAARILQEIGPDGAARLTDYIQRVEARRPKWVKE